MQRVDPESGENRGTAELGALPLAAVDLEARLRDLGIALAAQLRAVVEDLPLAKEGPQRLAQALGLDKVLCSRVLKASRAFDPLAVLHLLPGPEPMRRFYRAARRKGVDAVLAKEAELGIDRFRVFLRQELGDRSSLDAALSAWLPEAKREFELRRKQAAFRAMSQLLGVSVTQNYGLVLLHPSTDQKHIDVVWVLGLFGIQRERPGARVKLATRRITRDGKARRPRTLDGVAANDLEGLRLDSYCALPPASFELRRSLDTMHYLLGDDGFGREARRDLVLAEVNKAELLSRPPEGRKGYVFVDVDSPSRHILFDVLVHKDIYPDATPELGIYDASFEGWVDVNDEGSELARLELAEELQQLKSTKDMLHPSIPRHRELLHEVFERLGWDPNPWRIHRCEVEYPLYGSQIVISFPQNGSDEPS